MFACCFSFLCSVSLRRRVDGGDGGDGDGDDAYHISGILELHSIAQCSDRSTDGRGRGQEQKQVRSLSLTSSLVWI